MTADLYAFRWRASDAADSTAPAAVSVASEAAMPETIDRGRGRIRPASFRHGARPRAAPNPPATKAMRNPTTTACHSDGAATGVRLPTAIAAVNSA